MKTRLFAFVPLVVFVWFGNSIGQAQNPDLPKPTEVIDSFIDALGGEMAISSIRTINTSAQSGMAAISYIFHEGEFLFETTFEGSPHMQIRTGFDGETWWMFGRKLSAETDANNLISIQYSYMFPPDAIRLRELITNENVIEPITVDGKSCFRIKVEGKGGLTIWNTFDADSKLLTERTEMMGDNCTTTEYSYRDVDGIQFVEKLELYSDSAGVRKKLGMQTFDTIEVNGDVDATRLELMKVR